MQQEPLITIGITAYNAAATIKCAVTSALAQDWPATEIVVVDDASTDSTVQILQSYDNLRIFTQDQNKGVAAARNRIIREAKGDFIAFFDDDDESTPDRLSRQYQRIIKYNNTAPVLCHTARLQKYPDGREIIAPTAGCSTEQSKAMLSYILWGKPCLDCYGAMATCSQMAHKSVYENLGGFDESLRRAEDTDLTVRHAAAGGCFIGIKEPLVTQTMTMSSDKNLAEELACTLYYLEKHKGLFPSPAAYEFQQQWIRAKYSYFAGDKTPLIKSCLTHPLRSFQKIIWALPNYATNQRFKSFYKNEG